MKKLNTILLYLLSIASTISIIAVNKEQIKLSNRYGDDVLIHMQWRYGILSKQSDIIIKKNENRSIKAPVSGYKLFSIDVTPSVNLATFAIGGASSAIAYGVTHSMNHHTIRHHGNKFFAITKENKKSQISSQKQIKIQGYKTKEEYDKASNINEVAKEDDKEVPKVKAVAVDESSTSSDSQDYPVIEDSRNQSEILVV